MERKNVYEIGDKVQAHDGRIGVVIEIDRAPTLFENNPQPRHHEPQQIVVKFPDQSTVGGSAENFKTVSDRPFGHVE
jgi:hypothetical protein